MFAFYYQIMTLLYTFSFRMDFFNFRMMTEFLASKKRITTNVSEQNEGLILQFYVGVVFFSLYKVFHKVETQIR